MTLPFTPRTPPASREKRTLAHWVLTLFFGLLAGTGASAVAQTQAQNPGEVLNPVGSSSGHKLILCQDGTVKGWGDNSSGQLGNNAAYPTTPVTVPVVLPAGIVQVAVVPNCSFAILSDGTLWAWGSNDDGKLGVGSGTLMTTTAMQVPTLSNVIAVAGGFYHVVALCADGTVWSWGRRGDGSLGTGSSGASVEYTPSELLHWPISGPLPAATSLCWPWTPAATFGRGEPISMGSWAWAYQQTLSIASLRLLRYNSTTCAR